MKTTIFTLVFFVLISLFSLNKVSGQWATSGTNIYNTNSGSVGIGNNAPSTLLYVAKSMTEPTITVRNLGGFGGATYTMTDDASGANWKFKATTTGGFKIRDHANLMDVISIEPNSAANSIYIKTGGYMGMGTNNPAAKLHVFNNDRALIIDGLSAINTAAFQGLGFQYDMPNGEGAIMSSYPGGIGYLSFYTTSFNMYERMRITYDGNVGIGTTFPGSRLHVEVPSGTTSTVAAITNLQNEANANGLYINTTRTSSDAYILNAASGETSRLYVKSDGNVGIGTTVPFAKLNVVLNANAYSRIGNSSTISNYLTHTEVVAEGDGQATLYAFRTREAQNDGSYYGSGGTNNAMVSNNYWGDLYTFGMAGYSYNDFTRTGGVLGAEIGGAYWGSLGYKNSGSTTYGGYFSNSGSGAGKSVTEVMTGIGMGAWGDLMGADIHGEVYGTYSEGENYAVFADGDVYNNKLDIHLQENGSGTKTVLYTNTSTQVTVQTSGKATLSGGRAVIDFDPAFTAALASEESLVITVTPIGESNGVYLDQVSKAGFTIAENNSGRSSVTVNYIAIGQRAGYENPSLASEVISADYTGKVSRGLRPDANTQIDSEGLYYENGRLTVGVHPSTLPDPNRPKDIENIALETAAPVPAIIGVDPATRTNK